MRNSFSPVGEREIGSKLSSASLPGAIFTVKFLFCNCRPFKVRAMDAEVTGLLPALSMVKLGTTVTSQEKSWGLLIANSDRLLGESTGFCVARPFTREARRGLKFRTTSILSTWPKVNRFIHGSGV